MSELSGDGEAGVPPETPSGGTDATSGSRFAGYSDAEVDAALAAEDPGEDPAPEPPPGPGEQAGREEDPGQRDEDPGQRADAGPWEGAALPGGDETGPGESAGEDDNGDGSAQDEACPAADADGPEYSGDPGGEYDGGVADLLAEEEPATDAGELPPGSPQAGHADAPPAPEARPDDDGATPSAGPDGVSVRQPGDSTEPAVQAAAGDSRHDGQDRAHDPSDAHDPPEKGRPGYADIPGRYPENYKPAPDDVPLPAVDGPHQPPEKWIDAINPNKADAGRSYNCGDCARSVDGTWHGHPAVAAAVDYPRLDGEYASFMTEWAGVPREPASMADIKERLSELGSGSSAVVGCDWVHGGGHWFNAVNDGGTVLAVDGQKGKVGAWPPTRDRFGWDPSQMRRSDAIFFTSDGKAVRNDHK